MPHWKEDQLQQLIAETNEQRMFDTAASLTRQLGMKYFSFVTRSYVATQKSQVITTSNYPEKWTKHYESQNYLSIDPIMAHCHNSLMPILWKKEVFRETPQFWEEAKSHGLCFGWSQSAHDQRHNESVLSVVRSHEEVSLTEFFNTAGQTIWLCNLMHTLILERRLNRAEPEIKLTARETEVLKWSAAGKTAADVACILTLSQSTVNFHIRSIITKLNASNKAGAIAIAAMKGLLE